MSTSYKSVVISIGLSAISFFVPGTTAPMEIFDCAFINAYRKLLFTVGTICIILRKFSLILVKISIILSSSSEIGWTEVILGPKEFNFMNSSKFPSLNKLLELELL